MRVCLFMGLTLAIGACTDSTTSDVAGEPATRASAVADADAAPSPVAEASAEAGGASSIEERTELYIFTYAYPEEAGNIPRLAALLDERGQRAKAELVRMATRGAEAAEESGFPYNAYSFNQKWQVVAETPGYLSLSSIVTGYEGGAHGSYGTQALVWDKEQGKAIRPRDLFTSVSTLENALGEDFCSQLNRLRERKRGEKVAPESTDPFDACPQFSELAILVGSSNGRKFNRIGLIADPYVAGPWAEGKYEVTLPVSLRVIDAAKPEYEGAFSIGK